MQSPTETEIFRTWREVSKEDYLREIKSYPREKLGIIGMNPIDEPKMRFVVAAYDFAGKRKGDVIAAYWAGAGQSLHCYLPPGKTA